MNIGESFATVLKAKRRDKKLTQEQLAEKCGTSTRYISSLECNAQQPTLGYIYVICEALGMSMAEFMQEIEKQLQAQ